MFHLFNLCKTLLLLTLFALSLLLLWQLFRFWYCCFLLLLLLLSYLIVCVCDRMYVQSQLFFFNPPWAWRGVIACVCDWVYVRYKSGYESVSCARLLCKSWMSWDPSIYTQVHCKIKIIFFYYIKSYLIKTVFKRCRLLNLSGKWLISLFLHNKLIICLFIWNWVKD